MERSYNRPVQENITQCLQTSPSDRLALGLLLALNIFFAISETSLFSLKPLDRLRLKQQRPRRASIVEDLLGQSHRLLITTILGVEFVTILASIVGTSLALTLWGDEGRWLALAVFSPEPPADRRNYPFPLALTYPTGSPRRWLPSSAGP